MPADTDDRERSVVPRWRSFVDALLFGEVNSLQLTSSELTPKKPLSLTTQLMDWEETPGISTAADFVAAALIANTPEVAKSAAQYLLSNAATPYLAAHLAGRYLSLEEKSLAPAVTQNFALPLFSELRASIARTKHQLRRYPRNPVQWMQLALLYTTLGQPSSANHAVRVAMALSPHDRYVTRSACRSFIHQGRPDIAHRIILDHPALARDPWLLAAEIALSEVVRRPSRFLKTAVRAIEQDRYSPFDSSELCGALATQEAFHGDLKRAKKYSTNALRDPAENSIAQIAWLGRTVASLGELTDGDTAKSAEAQCWTSYNNSDWEQALTSGLKWFSEQPFSSRPATITSNVATSVLGKYAIAIEVLERSLVCNPDDAVLLNNLAFTLAHVGRTDDAIKHVDLGIKSTSDSQHLICLIATRGFIEYRRQNSQAGRLLYDAAISKAGTSFPHQRALAICYKALEETRLRTPDAARFREAARSAIPQLQGPLRSVMQRRIESSVFSALTDVVAPDSWEAAGGM